VVENFFDKPVLKAFSYDKATKTVIFWNFSRVFYIRFIRCYPFIH